MAQPTPHELAATYDSLAAIVRDRLTRNERIRRTLPEDGRVRIDRQLPFLCVYRAPQGPDAGTRELVTTEAAYVFASGKASHEPGLLALVRAIAETLREPFGALLLIEIWAEDDRPAGLAPRDATRPGFRIVTAQHRQLAATLTALEQSLGEITSQGWTSDVDGARDGEPHPRGLSSLAAAGEGESLLTLGIAVRPVYRDANTGAVFPVVLRSLRRQLAAALRKGIFAFTGKRTDQGVLHYQALGPSALVKAARVVDQVLAEASQAFDFVLQTVPLNSAAAWEEFQVGGCREAPVLYYRPLPYDPAALKRQLYEAPIDRIEDATLIHLFAEKQDHLDRQLTALKNINAPPFFYDSLQLYGKPDGTLVQLARGILARLNVVEPRHDGGAHGRNDAGEETLHTAEIVAAAREQIDYYHERLPGFVATVHERRDLASTMMVAKDRLLVASPAAISRRVLMPLLHHEVGTHLLTYFNGRQQPLQQMFAGFACYEELQEGLAVLAEYLAGGLTPTRLRTLACRVLGVQALVEGRSFVETYHLLHDEHRMAPRSAFMTTLRIYRGGGLTKDAIYLRGLKELLAYLAQEHDLEPLYVGKIALAHVPLVQELRRRGIVGPPALLPSVLDDADAQLRLERCRRGNLLELVETLP
jgi:uncharacterized protein (TIGR02421 family)